MKLVNKKILLISPETWGVMKVSKHHYALELARRGNEVYFLNPPTGISSFKKTEITKGLVVIDWPNVKGLNRIPYNIRKKIQAIRANRLLKRLGIFELDIVWSFDPFVFQNLKGFRSKLSIFHPVDVHQTFLDLDTGREADIIFCTSDMILSKYSDINCPMYQINHGLREDFVNPELECEVIKKSNNNVRIAYLGNLQQKHIHFPTLSKIVNENSNVDFYFIGPNGKSNLRSTFEDPFDYSSLEELSNTVFVGPLEGKKVAKVLGCFDGFLVSYETQNKAMLSNLHKVLEYLSTGKVVISSYSDQYKLNRELIEMVDNISELPNTFKNVISKIEEFNTPEKMELRKKFAFQNTYANQVTRIEEILNRHFCDL